jgi:hypothetical protein
MNHYLQSKLSFLLLLLTASLAAPLHAQEWQKLFNGENFDGWELRGAGKNAPTFVVREGAIVGSTLIPFNKTAFMATKRSYKNFDLVFDVKITGNLNSGVQIRSTPKGAVKGAQIEIDPKSNRTGYIYGQGMGQWFSHNMSKKESLLTDGEWHSFRALVRGNRIQTWIDGVPVEDLISDKIAPEGVIALQVHAHPRGKTRAAGTDRVLTASWRNIKVKELN